MLACLTGMSMLRAAVSVTVTAPTQVSPCDTLTVTSSVVNTGQNLDNLRVYQWLPSSAYAYVPGSLRITLPDGSVSTDELAYLSITSGTNLAFNLTAVSSPAVTHLVLSEVRYATDTTNQWVEIFNPGPGSVDLAGWKLTDAEPGASDVLPSYTLPALGYVVVVADSAAFAAAYPSYSGGVVAIADGAIGSGLAQFSDGIFLRDPSNALVDAMSWGFNTTGLNPAMTYIVSGTASAERNPVDKDSNTRGDWIEQATPNPGTGTLQSGLASSGTVRIEYQLSAGCDGVGAPLTTYTTYRQPAGGSLATNTTVRFITFNQPDLNVEASPATQSASLGEIVTFTFTVENGGFGEAQNAVLTGWIADGLEFVSFSETPIDVLPLTTNRVTWDSTVIPALASLGEGQSVSVTVTARVKTCQGALYATTDARFGCGPTACEDTTLNGGTSTASVLFQGKYPAISMTMSPNPGTNVLDLPYCGGYDVQFSISNITHANGADARTLRIDPVIPEGYVLASTSAGVISAGNIELGDLAMGATTNVTIHINPGGPCPLTDSVMKTWALLRFVDPCDTTFMTVSPTLQTRLTQPSASVFQVLSTDTLNAGGVTNLQVQVYLVYSNMSSTTITLTNRYPDNATTTPGNGWQTPTAITAGGVLNATTKTITWSTNLTGSGTAVFSYSIEIGCEGPGLDETRVTAPSYVDCNGCTRTVVGSGVTSLVYAGGCTCCATTGTEGCTTPPASLNDPVALVEACAPQPFSFVVGSIGAARPGGWSNLFWNATLGAPVNYPASAASSIQVLLDGVDITSYVAVSQTFGSLLVRFDGLTNHPTYFVPTAVTGNLEVRWDAAVETIGEVSQGVQMNACALPAVIRSWTVGTSPLAASLIDPGFASNCGEVLLRIDLTQTAGPSPLQDPKAYFGQYDVQVEVNLEAGLSASTLSYVANSTSSTNLLDSTGAALSAPEPVVSGKRLTWNLGDVGGFTNGSIFLRVLAGCGDTRIENLQLALRYNQRCNDGLTPRTLATTNAASELVVYPANLSGSLTPGIIPLPTQDFSATFEVVNTFIAPANNFYIDFLATTNLVLTNSTIPWTTSFLTNPTTRVYRWNFTSATPFGGLADLDGDGSADDLASAGLVSLTVQGIVQNCDAPLLQAVAGYGCAGTLCQVEGPFSATFANLGAQAVARLSFPSTVPLCSDETATYTFRNSGNAVVEDVVALFVLPDATALLPGSVTVQVGSNPAVAAPDPAGSGTALDPYYWDPSSVPALAQVLSGVDVTFRFGMRTECGAVAGSASGIAQADYVDFCGITNTTRQEVTALVLDYPELTLTKTMQDALGNPDGASNTGETNRFVLTVAHATGSSGTAFGMQLEDTFPTAHYELISATPPPDLIDGARLVWSNSTLQALTGAPAYTNGMPAFSVVVFARALNNCVSPAVNSAQLDYGCLDDLCFTATDSVSIARSADPSIVHASGALSLAECGGSYTVTIRNGGALMLGLKLTNTAPAGYVFTSARLTGSISNATGVDAFLTLSGSPSGSTAVLDLTSPASGNVIDAFDTDGNPSTLDLDENESFVVVYTLVSDGSTLDCAANPNDLNFADLDPALPAPVTLTAALGYANFCGSLGTISGTATALPRFADPDVDLQPNSVVVTNGAVQQFTITLQNRAENGNATGLQGRVQFGSGWTNLILIGVSNLTAGGSTNTSGVTVLVETNGLGGVLIDTAGVVFEPLESIVVTVEATSISGDRTLDVVAEVVAPCGTASPGACSSFTPAAPMASTMPTASGGAIAQVTSTSLYAFDQDSSRGMGSSLQKYVRYDGEAAPGGSHRDARVGEALVYRIRAELFNASFTNVVILESLPPNLAFGTPVDTGSTPNWTWTFNPATGAFTASADITSDAVFQVDIPVVVTNALLNQMGVRFTNTASMTYSSIATNLPPDSSTTAEVFEPRLTIAKSTTLLPVDGGDLVIFTNTVDVTVNTNAIAYDVVFTDTLPASLAYEAFGSDGLDNDGDGSTDEPDEATIVSGTTATITSTHNAGLATVATNATQPFVFLLSARLVNPTVGVNLTNTNTVQWSSLPGSTLRERTGADGIGGLNDYVATSVTALTLKTNAFAKVLVGTEVNVTGNNTANQATIGELLTYAVTITVPEGVTPGAQVVDTLDSGLAFVDLVSVVPSSGVTVANTLLPLPSANVTVGSSGRVITYALGDITNSNTDDGAPDTVVLTYRVVVVNANGTPNVQEATTWNNAAVFTSTAGASLGASAVDVTVVEPFLAITQEISRTNNAAYGAAVSGIDAGEFVYVRIAVTNAASAGATRAFDLAWSNALPSGLVGNSILSVVNSGLGTVYTNGVAAGATLDPATFGFSSSFVTNLVNFDLDPGGSVVLIVAAKVAPGVEPNRSYTNTAAIRWSSLDGVFGSRSAYETASSERDGATNTPTSGQNLASDNTVLNNYAAAASTVSFTSLASASRKSIVYTSESGSPGPFVIQDFTSRGFDGFTAGADLTGGVNTWATAGNVVTNANHLRIAGTANERGGAYLDLSPTLDLRGIGALGLVYRTQSTNSANNLVLRLTDADGTVIAFGNSVITAQTPGTLFQQLVFTITSGFTTATAGSTAGFDFGAVSRIEIRGDLGNSALSIDFDRLEAIRPIALVGEVVRFHIVTQIPEGTFTDMVVEDALPSGMAFLNDDQVRVAFVSTTPGNLTSTSTSLQTTPVPALTGTGLNQTGDDASVSTIDLRAVSGLGLAIGEGTSFDVNVSSSRSSDADTYNNGTDISFKLGTVSNVEDDADGEYVVIEFNALVLNDTDANPANSSGIQAGFQMSNTAQSHLFGTASTTNVAQTASTATDFARVTAAEPQINNLSKRVLGDPADAGDALTYRIQFSNGPTHSSAYESTVRVATTAALSGASFNAAGGVSGTGRFTSAPSTVDGLALASDDRVLVKDQASQLQNGIYKVVQPGTWDRALDFDSSAEVTQGYRVGVSSGTLNSGRIYQQETNSVTLNTTEIVFTQVAQDPSVRAASTGNIADLSAVATTMDGVTLALGDRVLVKNQSNPNQAQNGIYSVTALAASATLSRVTDLDVTAEQPVGYQVYVREGTQAGRTFGASSATAWTVTDLVPAYDVVLTDTLPSTVQLGGITISATGGVTYSLPAPFSAGTFAFTGGSVTVPASGTTGASVTVTLDRVDPVQEAVGAPTGVTVEIGGFLVSALPARTEVQNTARVTYTSLPGAGTTSNPTGSNTPGSTGASNGERNGSGISNPTDNSPYTFRAPTVLNNYAAGATVLHSARIYPGVDKQFPGGSVSSDDSNEAGFTDNKLLIGESVTNDIVVTMPEGVTPAVVVTENIPAGLRVTSVDLLTTTASAPALAADFNGTVSLTAPTLPANGAGTLSLTLGSVTTSADNVSNNNSFILRLGLLVLDTGVNTNSALRTNRASLNYTSATLGSTETIADTNTANDPVMELREPFLEVLKSTDDADKILLPGQVVTYTVLIRHRGISGAPAYDIEFRDVVPSPLAVVGGSLTTTGATVTSDTSSGNTFTLAFDTLAVGSTITLTYQAVLPVTAPPGTVMDNHARIYWDTLPGDGSNAILTGSPDGDEDRDYGATTTTEAHNADTDPAQDVERLTVGILNLGDYVWLDRNGDGVQDAGEPGIPGVRVWIDVDNDTIQDADELSDVTDSSGLYGIPGVAPGTYVVRVDASTVPADLSATYDLDGVGTLGRTSVTLTTADRLDVDWGYRGTAALGDYVWVDLNRDGVQDATEEPIAGVVVYLDLDTDGVRDATEPFATTASNGLYSIGGLGAGSYLARVDTNTLPAGVLQTYDLDGLATAHRASVTLTTGQVRTDVDFGYVGNAAIGNYVWLDEDSDGIQDVGERGIPQVRINLYSSTGQLLRSTWTDSEGGYLFPGVVAGSYFVDVVEATLPVGLSASPTTRSGADFGSQDGGTNPGGGDHGYPVTVSNGGENLTADFGYNWNPSTDVDGSTGTAALGDRVWRDTNADGIQDPEEPGIEGVEIELIGPGADQRFGTSDDAVLTSTLTDATGRYLFDGLAVGAYRVRVAAGNFAAAGPLEGFDATFDADRTLVLDHLTTTPVLLGPGDVYVNGDFGYRPASGVGNSIGDLVWFDADADGTYEPGDGEYGIARVAVALIRDTNGDGAWDADGADNTLGTSDDEPVVATTTTNGSGAYLFDGLPDGRYIVWVNDTGNVLGEMRQSADPGGAFDRRGASVDLDSAGASVAAVADLDQDFGFTSTTQVPGAGLVGDQVWLDLNSDGDRDPGEPGIEGVTVTVTPQGGGTSISTQTDENGRYAVGGLAAGTYVVTVSIPAGFTRTFDADGVGTVDSSVVVVGGAQPLIRLDQDFGYRGAGTIGNRIWDDANADGVSDPDGADDVSGTDDDEDGLGGVAVDLYVDFDGDGLLDPGEPLMGTTVTASDGSYSFSGLLVDMGSGSARYIVDVADHGHVLTGWWHSHGMVGTDDRSQPDPASVTLTPVATSNLAADFGYFLEPAAVGNRVWLDSNGDGDQDVGEPGLPGVVVTMVITYPGGSSTTVTTVTDTDGYYRFENLLLDEDYNGDGLGLEPSVVVSVGASQTGPGGQTLSPTTANSGTGGTPDRNDSDDDDNTGSNGLTAAAGPTKGLTDVSAGAASDAEPTVASYDFGFRPAGVLAIGNRVWLDNGTGGGTADNGLMDGAEVGISGVEMELYAADASGRPTGVALGRLTADSLGYYRFLGLFPGNYVVVVTAANFASGRPLFGLYSSGTAGGTRNGVDVDVDPTDRDDNGYNALTPSSAGIRSAAVTLATASEPTNEADRASGVDGDTAEPDANTNLTVDFGFSSPPPTAVTLAYVRGWAEGSDVWVEWQTLTEENTLGFDLERILPDGARVRVNPDLIAAENSPTGRRYQVRDDGVSGTGTHTYELLEWETTGARRVYGPFTVRVAPAATISNVQWTGEGKLVVGFIGTPGAEYLMESSPHLETGQWEVLGRIRADAAGAFRWVETVRPEEPTRFFRAIQP